MRDPKRIDAFLDEMKKVWHLVPDWRFGQLMINIFRGLDRDPFFIEDEQMLDIIKTEFDMDK